jgi:hypothetical protein
MSDREELIMSQEPTPTVVMWNRLEPRPRRADFSQSLRGEIHDALWMLTRQWQLGEFQGEDAGSIALSKLKMKTAAVTYCTNQGPPVMFYVGNAYQVDLDKGDVSPELRQRFQQNGKPLSEPAFAKVEQPGSQWTIVDGERNYLIRKVLLWLFVYQAMPSIPMETQVEREPLPLDLTMRLQMGQHWLRLIRDLDPVYQERYRARFPIVMPDKTAEPEAYANRGAWQLYAAAAGRGMDGGAFYQALWNAQHAEEIIAISSPDKSRVAEAATQFMARYDRLFGRLESGKDLSAWAPEQLEYQFSCAVPAGAEDYTALRSQEYFQGHLDWYAFEIDPDPGEWHKHLPRQLPANAVQEQTISFLPTEVRFAGMPNRRWWEMEDRRTNFGAIRADMTDLATLMLIEFGLVYGNDWLLFPYPVSGGSLCEVEGLLVTNVFGQRILIRPAGSGADENWQGWRMFNLSTRGPNQQANLRLFIPPVTATLLESEPIESVTFLRDEMADMVWAVESTVPNGVGGGMNGFEAARDLVEYIRTHPETQTQPSQPQFQPVENAAQIRYQLAGSVPENWIPFVPVHQSGSSSSIQLQRASMLRAIPPYLPVPVSPRGRVLRPVSEGEYFINEEEVSRAGAIVSRTYQRARWINGETLIWVGRRKKAGRGEGSSGLRFDQIAPKTPTSND